MKSRAERTLAAAALLLAVVVAQDTPAPASAQTPDVRIRIKRGSITRLALRLDEWVPSGDLASSQTAAQQARAVVKNDLTISGLFTLTEGPAVTDSAALSGLSEQAELAVEIRAHGSDFEVQARLYGLPGRSLISEKSYRASDVQLRRAAHQLSDDVVFQLSGEKGIAQSQLAWAQKVGGAKEIFVADYDGYGARQVTRDRNLDFSPAFSPDGRTLAFTSLRGRTFAIVLLELGTMREKVLASYSGSALSPSFSPDGEEVAFATSRDGNHEIYAIRRDGTGLRRLTHSPGIDVQPSYSPNGRQVAFCSDRAGSAQVYVMESDGSNPRRVTRDQARNEAPSWSPKGTLLAFMARQGNGYDVCMADASGGQVYNLTQGKGSSESPHWAGNGRHLVFVSNRDGRPRLHILNTDSGETFALPPAEGVQTPAWSR
ncbi:MAG: PD40 domain-containing protein [Candidatus Eisenbacteria bacterium]|nr:PD40 domain-containing protein [Candidatus Eisenbacteria bacterium]